MFGFLFQSSSWELVRQSDFFTKLIIFSLFICSIICVAIIILKFSYFRKELHQMKSLLARIRGVKSIESFYALNEEFSSNLGGLFLTEGLSEVKSLLKTENYLTESDINRLDVALNQTTDNAMLEAESYLPVLGVSAAVSPLIGLFGTIWGLIHAFVSIGQEKSADLAVVAPGIAEALITTLAGLIVAIPAMIFFHYFSNQLRKMEQMMGYLMERFFSTVIQHFSKANLENLLVSNREQEKRM